jgi:hypothetical protein
MTSINAPDKKIISTYLMGGLGNQLFQIFTTLAYGLKTGSQVIFPYSTELNVGVTRTTYWDSFLIHLKKYTTYMDQIYTNNVLMSLPIYKEHGFRYSEIPQQNRDVLLYGYFQSYKYFESCKNELFSMIYLEKQQENMEYLYSQYFDHENIISMHFRLGDYKNIQDFHPIMPYEYYSNALNYVLSCRNNLTFRVLFFCEKDDIIDVSNIIALLIKEFPNVEFIKVDDTIDDWQQMLIMSCCRDNIIANSSFSWWGSFFNKNENKIVCYPCQWFGPNLDHDTIDLYPNTWKKIYF